MSTITVIAPLPDTDFDITEIAVPWKILITGGIKVYFTTEHGNIPECDPLLLTGVIFGKLGAEKEAIEFYKEMVKSEEFKHPIKWSNIDFDKYDGLLLAGGHAKGMKQYLESTILQEKIIKFFPKTVFGGNKVCAAICHGVILLARSIDPNTGKSVIFDRTTTSLTKYLERIAYFITAWKLGNYYRTYPEYVEDEVRRSLDNSLQQYKSGTLNLTGNRNEKNAFVVEDGNYISGRWPGDAYLLANKFLNKLKEIHQKQ